MPYEPHLYTKVKEAIPHGYHLNSDTTKCITRKTVKSMISSPKHKNFIWRRAETGVDTDFSTGSYKYHWKTVKVTISGAHHKSITLDNTQHDEKCEIILKTLISSTTHVNLFGKKAATGVDTDFSTKLY